ncbi:unnamed protein product, partial [Iphiclides podalirius]
MLKFVVLTYLLAAASAGVIAPLVYSAPGHTTLGYASPLLEPYNYRGPLSLAPGQPANILGSDGRPLDTLDVNLDRSAHITAKALSNGFHLLKKRSILVPVVGPINRVATPLNPHSVPFAYRYATQFTPISYVPFALNHVF